ncbi:hypothetical protein L1887_13913 [Cichorium endivia]|nr:hypothetical protein L1887_13913 [Cichorium endivia]
MEEVVVTVGGGSGGSGGRGSGGEVQTYNSSVRSWVVAGGALLFLWCRWCFPEMAISPRHHSHLQPAPNKQRDAVAGCTKQWEGHTVCSEVSDGFA